MEKRINSKHRIYLQTFKDNIKNFVSLIQIVMMIHKIKFYNLFMIINLYILINVILKKERG